MLDRSQNPSGSRLWWMTCFGYWLFGSFGLFFSLKEWLDPAFSDWLAPGPGSPLLGDSGRMLVFEAGPAGVQSKLLGVQANLLEGVLLDVGALSLLSCWFESRRMQLLTAYAAPVSAAYFLLNIFYFQLTGAPEMVPAMLLLGAPPILLSLLRLKIFLRDEAALATYAAYLAAISAAVLGGGLLLQQRAEAHRADIHLFVAVRDHFTSNGFTWTAGLDYPDGFKPPRASGWLGLF